MNRAAKANGKKGLPKSKSGLKKKKSQRSLKVWPAANNGDEWDEGMPGHWYADADGNEWWDAEGQPSYYWTPVVAMSTQGTGRLVKEAWLSLC